MRRAVVRRFGAVFRALRRRAGALRFAVVRRLALLRRFAALRRLAAGRGLAVDGFFAMLVPRRFTAASVHLNMPRTAAWSALSFG